MCALSCGIISKASPPQQEENPSWSRAKGFRKGTKAWSVELHKPEVYDGPVPHHRARLSDWFFFFSASKASRREIQWCCNVTARLNRSDLACGQDLKEQFTQNSVIIHSPHADGSSKPANFLLASQLNSNAAFSEGVRGCFKGPMRKV